MQTYTYKFDALDGVSDTLRQMAKPVTDFKKQMTDLKKSIGGGGLSRNLKQLKADVQRFETAKDNAFSTDEIKQFNRQITRTQAKINRLENIGSGGGGIIGGLKNIKKSVGGLGLAVAGAFTIDAIADFGGSVIDTVANFERYEARLTNLFGSKSAAREQIETIKNLAAETPFQVDELVESFSKLATPNFTPTVDEMRSLGDFAAFNTKSFEQLAEAMNDAQTFEFERLKEFKINSKQDENSVTFTNQNTGESKTVAKNAAAIRAYILAQGKANGIKGAAAAQAKTLGGLLNNLGDKLMFMRLELGELAKPLIKVGINVISDVTENLRILIGWIKDNKTEVVEWVKAITKVGTAFLVSYASAKLYFGFAAVVKSIAKAYRTLRTAILAGTVAQTLLNGVMLMNPVGLLTAGIMAAIGVIYLMVENWDFLKGYLISFGEFFLKYSPFGWLLQVTDYFFPQIKEGLKSLIGWITDKFGMLADWISGLFNFETSLKIDVTEPDVFSDNLDTGLFDNYDPKTGGTKPTEGKKGLSLGLSDVQGGGGNVKHISININKLVEKIVFEKAQQYRETEAELKERMSKILLSVVNDVNYQ